MITYDDKVATNPLPNVPANWVADNANEVKTEVNANITATQQAQSDADAAASAISTHAANTSNPHGVTKTQVGLGNVDNTSDAGKPVSTATQTALDLKQNKTLVIRSVSIDDTLVLTDAGNPVELTGSNPRTITIPPNIFPINSFVYLLRTGTGAMTVAGGVGVTVTGTAGVLTDPGQNILMTAVQTGTNTWVLQNGVASATYTAFTPTLTGFASTTLNVGSYSIDGKKCTFEILIAGTAASASPTSTITNMPAIAKRIWPQLCIVVNNTTIQTGRGDIAEGTTVLTVWATVAQGSFTSSVGRQIYINGTFEIQ